MKQELKLEVSKKYKIINKDFIGIADCIYKILFEHQTAYVAEVSDGYLTIFYKKNLHNFEITEQIEGSMEKQKLKIEVGKMFKDGRGKTVFIVNETLHKPPRFRGDYEDGEYSIFSADGKWDDSDSSELDLIEEVKEEPIKEEMKLEIGKKYDLEFAGIIIGNPFQLLLIDNGDLIFRNSSGSIFTIYNVAANTTKINVHYEPIKSSVTGPFSTSLLDELFKLPGDRPYPELTYGTLTFEEKQRSKEAQE